MMLGLEPMQLIAFMALSIALIVTPGPNVMVIISTSLQAGVQRGLQTVAGTQLAMALQLIISALGTSALLAIVSNGFSWIKWAGVTYLLVLGIGAVRRGFRGETTPAPSAIGSARRGFLISLTNPKTILFFSAFLPQFVTDAARLHEQLALLSLLFWILAGLFDSAYALLAGRLRGFAAGTRARRMQNGVSGALYIGAGVLLAGTRNPH